MKLNETTELPDDYLYDESYGWAKIDGKNATIGVTLIGVNQTKEIAYIELPQVGDKFKKGDNYAVMEAAKWAGELKMPLSGEVVEVNEDKLLDDPGLLNKNPYENWIIKVKIENKSEVSELMDVKKAAEFYKDKL